MERPQDLQGFIVDGDFDFQLSLAGKLKLIGKAASASKLIDKTISLAEWEKMRDLEVSVKTDDEVTGRNRTDDRRNQRPGD